MGRTLVYKDGDNYYVAIDGNEPIKCEVKQPKGWDETIFLPTNPANRKYINKAALDKKLETNAQYELEFKESKTLGPRGTTKTNKKPAIEYLNEEDRATLNALMDKANTLKAEAEKPVPLTAIEKAKLEVERAMKKLADAEAATKEPDAIGEAAKTSKSNKKGKN